jgi:hypothetical protein
MLGGVGMPGQPGFDTVASGRLEFAVGEGRQLLC